MKTLICLIATLSATALWGAEVVDEKNADKWIYRDLTDVKKFYLVLASVQGSAEAIGFSKQELKEFVVLKVKSTFPGFPIEDFTKDKAQLRNINEREWAYLEVKVWTVGDDYPVAYHLEVRIEKLRGGGAGYRDSILGFSSAKKLKDDRVIKNSISDLLERAAVTLLKAQGKM